MPDFDSLDQLFKYVEKQTEDVMEDEIAPRIKKLQAEHVESDVYDAYTSQTPYMERRRDEGGLSDTDNMIHTVTSTVNGLELFIKNITTGNPDVVGTHPTLEPNYLAGIIEYGRNSGRYMRNRTGTEDDYLGGRPFISNTIRELEMTLMHVDWYKNGMRRRGIDIE